ncbi:hypothetical protein EDC01DRAFT_777335 [Geopyxis carbonaria]|nr:hypothetical protein EDC01DRAFT_777335 [Geopyxis carbonaria]
MSRCALQVMLSRTPAIYALQGFRRRRGVHGSCERDDDCSSGSTGTVGGYIYHILRARLRLLLLLTLVDEKKAGRQGRNQGTPALLQSQNGDEIWRGRPSSCWCAPTTSARPLVVVVALISTAIALSITLAPSAISIYLQPTTSLHERRALSPPSPVRKSHVQSAHRLLPLIGARGPSVSRAAHLPPSRNAPAIAASPAIGAGRYRPPARARKNSVGYARHRPIGAGISGPCPGGSHVAHRAGSNGGVAWQWAWWWGAGGVPIVSDECPAIVGGGGDVHRVSLGGVGDARRGATKELRRRSSEGPARKELRRTSDGARNELRGASDERRGTSEHEGPTSDGAFPDVAQHANDTSPLVAPWPPCVPSLHDGGGGIHITLFADWLEDGLETLLDEWMDGGLVLVLLLQARDALRCGAARCSARNGLLCRMRRWTVVEVEVVGM